MMVTFFKYSLPYLTVLLVEAEAPTIVGLHEVIRESGHELRGKHHEIYMGDPRRTAPERLKTIIRQPVD